MPRGLQEIGSWWTEKGGNPAVKNWGKSRVRDQQVHVFGARSFLVASLAERLALEWGGGHRTGCWQQDSTRTHRA